MATAGSVLRRISLGRSRPDPSDRLREVLALPAEHGSCRSLLEAARDPSLDVARAALRRLAVLGSSDEADVLRRTMLTAGLGIVRDYARTLRALGDEEATRAAIDGLAHRSVAIRLAAALSLREVAGAHAAEPLRHALKDSIAGVRRFALQALAELGRDDASADATAPLLRDPDADVRAEAVTTLLRVSSNPEPTLAPALGDPVARVRLRLAREAGALAAPTVSALLDDLSYSVRAETIWALVEQPRAELLSRIASATCDPAWEVRRAACRALGAAGCEDARTALLDALGDSHPTVRAAALRALQEVFGDAVADVLRDELSSAEPVRRRAGVYALGECEGDAVARIVAERAKDPDPAVRIAVVHFFARARSAEADALLTALTADDDVAVRHAAVTALDSRRAGR